MALETLLRCPVTGQPLHRDGRAWVTNDGRQRYPITESGIPLFAEHGLSPEGRTQQQHYDRVAAGYLTNLQQPHTQEYMAYLDAAFRARCPARVWEPLLRCAVDQARRSNCLAIAWKAASGSTCPA